MSQYVAIRAINRSSTIRISEWVDVSVGTIQESFPGTNEIQTVTTTSTSGSYVLSYGGQQTASIAYNATNTAFKAALADLNNLDAENISVTLSTNGSTRTYTITFTHFNAEPLSVVSSALAGTNEIQTVAVKATGGTYTLTYAGQTTAAIAYNASSATLRTRLGDLNNLDPEQISVASGISGGGRDEEGGASTRTYTITFINMNAALLVASSTSNLSGSGKSITVTQGTQGIAHSIALGQGIQGAPPVDEVQEITFVGVSSNKATDGTFTLTFNGETTGNIAHDASPQDVEQALIGIAGIGPEDVLVTGVAKTAFQIEFTGALTGTNVSEITAESKLMRSTRLSSTKDSIIDLDNETVRRELRRDYAASVNMPYIVTATNSNVNGVNLPSND
jgi:hypothetical protein